MRQVKTSIQSIDDLDDLYRFPKVRERSQLPVWSVLLLVLVTVTALAVGYYFGYEEGINGWKVEVGGKIVE